MPKPRSEERLSWWQRLLRPDAFQIAMLLIASVRGITYVTGFVPSSVAEQTLPVPLRILCLSELALGAMVCLVGRLRENLRLERAGLKLLAPSALAYGLLIGVASWHKGAVSAVIYCAMAWASASRLHTIRRRTQIIEQVRNEQS